MKARDSRDAPGRARGEADRSGPEERHLLTLPPSPDAPRVAREWVAARLPGWPAPCVANAALVVSELVTNAMLHAGTTIVVRCEPSASHARLEVCDARGDAPVRRTDPEDALTGRGLRLVATLAEEWGVLASEEAKAVWCVISADSSLQRPGGTRDRVGGRPPAGGTDAPRAARPSTPRTVLDASGGGDRRAVRVVLLHLPLSVYDAVRQHADAVVRELALIAQSAGSPRAGARPAGARPAGARPAGARPASRAPRALVELAGRVRADFARVAQPLRVQVARARETGAVTVDLVLDVPVDSLDALRVLADRFDEADRYCEAGELLTLASSPALRRFRRWYATQILGQAHGLAPTPWDHEG